MIPIPKLRTAGRMGSILVEVLEDSREDIAVEILSTGQPNGNGFKSFEFVSLAADENATQTGLKEEVVLLSWLIVLLRTREGQISFDWAYRDRGDVEHELVTRCLSMEKVMPGSHSSVERVAAAIMHDITTDAPSQRAVISIPASLVLSSSSVSQTSEIEKGEVSENSVFFMKLLTRDQRILFNLK